MHTKPFVVVAASLVLLACGDRSSPAPAPAGSAAPLRAVASAAAPSAAPAASSAAAMPAKAPGPRVSVVTGLKAKGRNLRLSLDRDGDDLRGYMVNDGASQGVVLRGKMLDDRRFRISQPGKVKAPEAIEGEIDGGRLDKLTLREGKARPVALTTAPHVPFGAKEEKQDLGYSGALGDKLRIRAQVARDGKAVSGYYRYARSREDIKLTGSVDLSTGKFELTETGAKGASTGRFKGFYLDAAHLLGTWESADGSRSMPFTLEATKPVPRVLELAGGIKIIPHEIDKAPSEHCTITGTFPEFEGLSDKKAQAELNKKFAQSSQVTKNDKESCKDSSVEATYSFEDDYSVTSTRHAGYVGLSQSSYAYTGGAHGMPGSRCMVIDLSKGRSFELHEMLGPDALARLTDLANKKLMAENKVTDLTEADFFESKVKVNEKPDLCLTDAGVDLVFSVYEVAPYAMGTPTVSLSSAEAKPLFKKDAVIDALFK